MSKLRVVFMGTPDFAVPCLDALVKGEYNVVAVVTQPDRPKGRGQKLAESPVKQAAISYKIPVLQPNKVKDPGFQDVLFSLKPDIIVVVAFGQLLPKMLLDLPPLGCINVHASLLPLYRGAAPIHWSIIKGDKVTGVTTMFMDIGMDTGDMILKEKVSISEMDTTGDIHDKLKNIGAKVLSETMKLIVDKKAPRLAQNNEEATYASMLTRELERINWQEPAVAIHNLVRGLNPWPGAYCFYQDKNLKIWQTRIYPTDDIVTQSGRIAKITAEGFVVETRQGLLEILEVQPASKRRMRAIDFICGYGLRVGDILE
ncbi:methionyl-tRNA formyltransferase [Pelosinus propionicus]|uniref:Methionyl-tRNA formyltransferase n=1 Tax=Pelosinus propionicus DSM 13327 TaxID=1123291 RepID=A0A1I4L8F9_9FIRM|nr:methionyl-tRNA formyltransferase [Pelosinus propionicus]SFL87302.1 methionyl-tRNA formyltransferase [Pelosinus propionicus DSM 13327]